VPDDSSPVYVLGDRNRELRRLSRQHEYWGDFTLEVLRRAGVGPDMRVLDVGSGSGDVAMIAASLVGPGGEVIGVDRAAASVERANARAAAAELANVEFVAAELGTFEPAGPFDAVIGRFSLMYLADPAALLRRLAASLSTSGVLAFIEMDLEAARATPTVPLVHDTLERMRETLRRAGVAIDLGPRLWRVYRTIGISRTEILVDARAEPAPATDAMELVAEMAISLLPMMERLGIARPGEFDDETLAVRLREALVERQATLIPPNVVGTIGRTREP
jgi:ubiquinone/menaquinone biosynthesis C-methylase UbiE